MRIEEIVVATGNTGKIREFAELWKNLPVRLRGLNEFPNIEEVEETGTTFTANAELKAVSYAAQTTKATLADDSGLEVAALGNAPGVFSARYAGENATNEEKIAKLLAELDKTGDEVRRAKFVCVIVLAAANGEILYRARGECAGKIIDAPRGTNGFGYDPIFVPDGFEQTFGELSAVVKHKISHRARAANEIFHFLQTFCRV